MKRESTWMEPEKRAPMVEGGAGIAWKCLSELMA